jgi:predicted nucleotidyltransferase
MMTSNLQMLEIVAEGLQQLREDVVFIGGATSVLYIDSAGGRTPRPTDDVDCVIELATRTSYRQLEDRLRRLGFTNCIETGAPICRWLFNGLKVDVMPTDDAILGFTNHWYKNGVRDKEIRTLPRGTEIFVFPLVYWIASKLAAYFDRGSSDPLISSDLEDIIYVLDGIKDPVAVLQDIDPAVGGYISDSMKALLLDSACLEAIEGALAPEGPARVRRMQQIWRALAERKATT